MIIKKGVKTLGLKPEILLAIFIVDKVYTDNGQELVITSITDGKHSQTSRHYLGFAFDTRTYYFTPTEIKRVARQIRAKLGTDYLVLIEKDHLHISWKPKR